MTNDSHGELDALWDFSDPLGSEARFCAWLIDREDSADGPLRAEGLTQLARSLGLQGKFHQAQDVLDEAEALLGQTQADRARVRILLERGRLLNSSGEREPAREQFVQAWESALACGDDALAVDAAHMVAIVEKPAAQVEWNERALSMARTSKDPGARKWLSSLLNNLAWTFHDMGSFERALGLFEEALAARLEQGKPESVRIARWSVARAKRSLGRFEEALVEQRSILAALEAADMEDGFVSEELGECFLALGRPEEAAEHFGKALRALSKDAWLVENEPTRIERLKLLSGEPQR